jgi:hypothetical protein
LRLRGVFGLEILNSVGIVQTLRIL